MKILFLIILLVIPISASAQQMSEHTVASGENLLSIANKYGITDVELKKANSGLGNYLLPGMVLKIPYVVNAPQEEKIILELEDDLNDIILLKDSSELVAKILNVNTDSVMFEQYDTDEPFSLPITQIISITFEDGSMKSFPEPKQKMTKRTTTIKRRTK